MKKKVIVIEGPARSGKGSLVKDILKKVSLATLAMSAELDKVGEAHPQEWPAIKAASHKGELVPDEYVVPALRAALLALVNSPHEGIILDGATRTTAQAEELLRVCEEHGWKITVFAVWATDEKLRERGEKRTKERAAQGLPPREDDDPIVFERRLQIFKDYTLDAIECLVDGKADRFRIDGNGTPEEAFTQVLPHLDLDGVMA